MGDRERGCHWGVFWESGRRGFREGFKQTSSGIQKIPVYPLLAKAGKLCKEEGSSYPGVCSGIDGFQNQYEVGKKGNFQKVGMVRRRRGTGVVPSTQCGACVRGRQDRASP